MQNVSRRRMPVEQLGKRGEATAMTRAAREESRSDKTLQQGLAMEIRERRPRRRTFLLAPPDTQTGRSVYAWLSQGCPTDHQAPAKAVTTANFVQDVHPGSEENEITNSAGGCKSHTIVSTFGPSARAEQSRKAT